MIGSAHDVIERYHEHLAAENTEATPSGTRDAVAEVFATHVEVAGSDGTPRHRFTEGEPFEIRVTLSAHDAVEATRITVTLRDELGREIGSHFFDHEAFAAGSTHVLALDLSRNPLRSGQFEIDLAVTDLASGRPLLSAASIESVSILGQRTESTGPVQLGGQWRID